MSDVLIDLIRMQPTRMSDGSRAWGNTYYTAWESGKFGWKFIGRCVRGVACTPSTFSSVVIDSIDSINNEVSL